MRLLVKCYGAVYALSGAEGRENGFYAKEFSLIQTSTGVLACESDNPAEFAEKIEGGIFNYSQIEWVQKL